jgi:gliding motility-associated-like protein
VAQPPALTLTVTSPTVCAGQTATVVANASGGASPYQYSFNGGAMQVSNSFTVIPTASTSYTLNVSDNNGCSSPVATSSIVVLPPLQVTTGDALICPGTPSTLTAIASGGNGNYTFTWQPGNLPGSTVTVNLQGGTIFTVTVSDGCTTTPATDTGKVSVYPVASPTLSPTLSGCAPLCVNFSVTALAGLINYQWNFGDNNSGSGPNPSHCYKNAGTYNVGLTYTTTQGCINAVTSNGMVNVFSLPNASFSASAHETTTLDPQISFYDQSTGGIASWQWNFGDGSTSVQQNPVHSFNTAGDYPVYLFVTNQQGCRDSVKVEILVKEDFTFFAPNAFTPDGDDDNDVFLPRGIGWDNTRYKLWIFDRWGNLVISTTEVDKGWDGTKHGANVQQDVYAWEAEVHDLYGMLHKYQGTVSLVR